MFFYSKKSTSSAIPYYYIVIFLPHNVPYDISLSINHVDEISKATQSSMGQVSVVGQKEHVNTEPPQLPGLGGAGNGGGGFGGLGEGGGGGGDRYNMFFCWQVKEIYR